MSKCLNTVYNENRIFFCCNACGEIALPSDTSIFTVHKPEELPEKERELYNEHWTDNYSAKTYVVIYNGEAGLAINFLFCRTFLEDVLNRPVTDNDMLILHRVIQNYADSIEKHRLLEKCSVLVGEDTDPDGHEMYVIVPYDEKANIEYILQSLDNTVYKDVELLIKERLLSESIIGFKLIEKLKTIINEHGFELKEDGTASGAVEIQVHSLWVAACLYLDWEPDTMAYDNALFKIWTEYISTQISFDTFDMFMCEGLC